MTTEQQKEALSKRVAIRKVRCLNWPNCNDPTCLYTHPTETVSQNLLKIQIKILLLVSLFPELFIWR